MLRLRILLRQIWWWRIDLWRKRLDASLAGWLALMIVDGKRWLIN